MKDQKIELPSTDAIWRAIQHWNTCEHLNARLQRYEAQPSIKNYEGPTLVVSNEHVR